MSHILSIVDDPLAASEIRAPLSAWGHQVDVVATGREALARMMSDAYDLVTLNRALPDLDGFALLAAMRSVGIVIPVLLLLTVSALDQRVLGLRAGGDDYLIKPFTAEEMATRVAMLLDRAPSLQSSRTRLAQGALEFDVITRVARFHGRELELMPTEQRMLEYLLRHPGQVLTRTMLFESVWGYRFDPGIDVMDVHISRLRGKLARFGSVPSIRTVRGTGYMLGA